MALAYSRALDWPLSRSEKVKTTIRLYEKDMQAANRLLEDKEYEVRALRRRSDQALAQVRRLTLAGSSPSASPEASPARSVAEMAPPNAGDAPFLVSEAPCSPLCEEKMVPTQALQEVTTPCRSRRLSRSLAHVEAEATAEAEPQAVTTESFEAELQGAAEREEAEIEAALRPASDELFMKNALVHYFLNRRIDSKGPAAAEAKAATLARAHADEARAAELWSKIAKDDELPMPAHVLWLARSLSGPTSSEPRSVRWRRALLPTSRIFSVPVDTAAERRAGYVETLSNASRSPGALELRAEAQQEAKAAWRDEAFMALPGVVDAVASICLAASAGRARHVQGTCHVAALLLYGLAVKDMKDVTETPPPPSEEALAAAETDAFWCLHKLLAEDQGVLVDDRHDGGGSASAAAANSAKVMEKRCQALLQAHDPAIAKILNRQGLSAMLATRIGAAYCTRAGFSLSGAAQVWDICLNDPRRFELCDYVVVGLVLAIRAKLLACEKQRDTAGLAEVLTTAPRTISTDTLLRTARALRAMEKRRVRLEKQASGQAGPSTARSHRARSLPPVQGGPEEAPVVPVGAGLDAFMNIWGNAKDTVRSFWSDTVGSARNAVRCLPKGALQKGSVHEEEMKPLQRQSRQEVAPTRTSTDTPNQLLMPGRLLDA